MLLKFIVAVAVLFPLAGVWLMEDGAYGGSISKVGYPNGATCAFGIYAGVLFLTARIAAGYRLFSEVGKRTELALWRPDGLNVRAFFLMFSMLLFVLFGIDGINNYIGITDAGTFRASLGAAGGLIGAVILKYVAPSMFALVLLTNTAWSSGRIFSPAVVSLALMLLLIGGAYGFKSSFVLALLPSAILYFWRSSPLMLLPLGFVALGFILFGYMWFGRSPDISVAFAQMTDRLFVLQGDVPWFVWNLHSEGKPLPPYADTLLPIVGDRLFSWLTDVTPENKIQWVMAHFGLMITFLSGYSSEQILAGLNNTGTVFSEGVIAGGMTGVVLFAVVAGLVVNLIYNVIDNRLKARDFAVAAVAASYFVNGIMAWLISGGVQLFIHISIPVLLYATYRLLNAIRGQPRRQVRLPEITHKAAEAQP